MQGQIDTSFETLQRDLFSSGLAARIGMNAFGVWLAIKSHADYNTGKAWPGMRRLAELTGLSLGSVSKSVRLLVEARLLRVVQVAKGRSRRGSTYVARERMDVRLGDLVLCTIVVDYVPATLRTKLRAIDDSLKAGRPSHADVFAECEIIPGEGFVWDAKTCSLRSLVPARVLPATDLTEEQLRQPIVQRLLSLQSRSARGQRNG